MQCKAWRYSPPGYAPSHLRSLRPCTTSACSHQPACIPVCYRHLANVTESQKLGWLNLVLRIRQQKLVATATYLEGSKKTNLKAIVTSYQLAKIFPVDAETISLAKASKINVK